MNRQEVLLNLTLVTVIGALAFSIYDSQNQGVDLPVAPVVANNTTANADEEMGEEDEEAPENETTYARAAADSPYTNVGQKDIFRSLVTPTPSPPPPTPSPTPTPDINKALGAWQVLSVYQGVATVQDNNLMKANSENAIWDMKLGESRPVDVGGGQLKAATLKSVNESLDLPTATFGLEGTSAERTMRMGDEPGIASGGEGGPPGGPPGGPQPR